MSRFLSFASQSLIPLSLSLAVSAGCGNSPMEATQKTPLRISLSPNIPDAAQDNFAALAARIESEFEKQNPDIDLTINRSCFQGDLYEPGDVSGLLSGSNPDCQSDVAEIDTLLLGEIVDTGAVQPWPSQPTGVRWYSTGTKASTYNSMAYGVPHWLRGEFIITRVAGVQNALSQDAMMQALATSGTANPDIIGNLLGSWNLPAIYLDAWACTHNAETISQGLSATVDMKAGDALKKISNACKTNTVNPCTDGTYNSDQNLPYVQFAQGKADAVLGNSDKLFTVLKEIGSGIRTDLTISYAPLGSNKDPMLVTDAFVLSKQCGVTCQQAAAKFVQYMSQTATYGWIVSSEDAPTATRELRYMLPASIDAYSYPTVQKDIFYQYLKTEIQTTEPYPNSGLYGIRSSLRDNILTYINM